MLPHVFARFSAQGDESVFQARAYFVPGHVAGNVAINGCLDGQAIIAADVKGGAEIGDMLDARLVSKRFGEAPHTGTFAAKRDKTGPVYDVWQFCGQEL